MHTTFLISALSLLTACGDDKSDTGDTATDAFSPTAGQWSWDGTEYTTDECNMADSFPAETVDATLWDLVLTDAGFQLDNEIWTGDPIECVVTGMDFSCDVTTVTAAESWSEDSENEGVPDATYTTIATISGSFTDADNGTVGMSGDLTCEGADCDAHGADNGTVAPCSTVLGGDFNRSE